MKLRSILIFCILWCLAACDKAPQGSAPEDVLVNVIPTDAMAVVEITTEDNAPIVSKEDLRDSAGCNIRRRGNSSWCNAEKKSYRLKFEENISLLGRPMDKSRALIANCFDKTMPLI